jgi:hypothetical protein
MTTKEEAQKLVRKVTALKERNWLVKICIDLNSSEFENVDENDAAKIVVQRLKEKLSEIESKLGPGAKMEYQGIIDAFEDEAVDPESTTGSFDSLMDELYDFGDQHGVWIGP